MQAIQHKLSFFITPLNKFSLEWLERVNNYHGRVKKSNILIDCEMFFKAECDYF